MKPTINPFALIGKGLVVFNGLIWLIVGVAALVRSNQVEGVPDWMYTLMAIGILGYGIILVISGVGLGKHKTFYYSAMTLVILSAVLTIFDDFGWVDLIAVLIFTATAVYLFMNRKLYRSDLHSHQSST